MRTDSRPELILLALAPWAEVHGVILKFIKLGKPTQNSFIERFNRTYRTEILNFYLFRTLNEACEITERWIAEPRVSGKMCGNKIGVHTARQEMTTILRM